MIEGRRRLKHAGLTAFVIALFLPEAVLIPLVGLAFGWWIAAFVGVAYVGVGGLLLAITRSRGAVDAVLGNAGWDPTDYAQWTRYLVIRPIVLSLPTSAFVIVAVLVTALLRTSYITTIAAAVVAGCFGAFVGGWLWLRAERIRAERNATGAQ